MMLIRLNFCDWFINPLLYSPDLNPIENVWGIAKTELKNVPEASNSAESFSQIKLLSIWNLPTILSV